jgi:hypothetical protein
MVTAVSAYGGCFDRVILDGGLWRLSQRLPTTPLLAILRGILQVGDRAGRKRKGKEGWEREREVRVEDAEKAERKEGIIERGTDIERQTT